MYRPLLYCLILALVVWPRFVGADVVYKKDGGKITGTIIRSESGPDHVTIKTRFGTFKVPQHNLEKIEYEQKNVEQYQEKAKTFKDTPEDQLQLALWCLENGHRSEYEKHLKRVIELDPDNGEARTRLGYRLYNGEWKTKDEYFTEQGYVKYRGEYVLPQERTRLEAKKDFTKDQREYYRNVRVWQKWLRQSDADRQAEATQNLLQIQDEAAVKPLVEILGDDGNDQERYLLVDVLANIEGDTSTQGLVLVALNDKVATNRFHAVDVLKKRKSVALVNHLAGVLRDNDNSRVRHAAIALGEIGDRSVIPALVDALVTTHRYEYEPSFMDQVRANSGAQYTPRTIIRPDGVMIRPSVRPPVIGGGLRVGQPPGKQVVIQEHKNQEVVDALRNLTGNNFGFDKERWLVWIREEYHEKAAEIAN